jgi:hypothetical protein
MTWARRPEHVQGPRGGGAAARRSGGAAARRHDGTAVQRRGGAAERRAPERWSAGAAQRRSGGAAERRDMVSELTCFGAQGVVEHRGSIQTSHYSAYLEP